jgi:hypothetical protein
LKLHEVDPKSVAVGQARPDEFCCLKFPCLLIGFEVELAVWLRV